MVKETQASALFMFCDIGFRGIVIFYFLFKFYVSIIELSFAGASHIV